MWPNLEPPGAQVWVQRSAVPSSVQFSELQSRRGRRRLGLGRGVLSSSASLFHLGGKDACAGDSGGPMVTLNRERGQWYLVGTVSWGDDCGKKDRYGVYSYIYHNKDWIQRVTRLRN